MVLLNSKIIIFFVFILGVSMVMADDKKVKDPKTYSVNLDQLLNPFWEGSTMYEESLFFCEKVEGQALTATLLFPPEKLLSIKSANGKTNYLEGKDFSVDRATGVLKLLPGSKIPSKTFKEMYPDAKSDLPKYGYKRGDPNTFLIFGEGHFFHDLQISVTYTHKTNLWKGVVPSFEGANMPKTMAKLKNKDIFTVCLSGDSISQGYNASGYTKVEPFLPSYGELVAFGFEKMRGSKINFKNFAIAGWTSGNGVAAVATLALEKPDLVIIAYGMNDSGGATPEAFVANIKIIMSKVKETSPDAEFILVSPMLPNAEWHNPIMERFPAYRDALAKLCGKGVVLADLTSVWTEVLKRKSFHDITGNGVNHPNDFGHRLYAQVILRLFKESIKK